MLLGVPAVYKLPQETVWGTKFQIPFIHWLLSSNLYNVQRLRNRVKGFQRSEDLRNTLLGTMPAASVSLRLSKGREKWQRGQWCQLRLLWTESKKQAFMLEGNNSLKNGSYARWKTRPVWIISWRGMSFKWNLEFELNVLSTQAGDNWSTWSHWDITLITRRFWSYPANN